MPGAVASSELAQLQAEREPSRIGRPRISNAAAADVALGRRGVVHVGDRALHRVVGLARRVGRDRVHPRDALVAPLDLVVLADRLGAVVREEVVEVAEVGRVHVSEREAVAAAPGEGNAHEAREHRAVLGRVDRAGHILGPAAVDERLDRDLGLLHVLRLTVDDIGVRVGAEGQLVGGEAPRGGDRVRPGQARACGRSGPAARRRASRPPRQPCRGS